MQMQVLIILNFAYPPLQELISGYTFLLFIVPLTIGSVALYFYLPETKNREVRAFRVRKGGKDLSVQVDDILRNWKEYTPRGRKLKKQREKYEATVRKQTTIRHDS